MPIPISDLSPNVIKAYQEELSKTASPATLKRKSASLNKFFDWASSEGYVPPASVPQGSPAMLVPENSTIITRPKKKISAKTWAMLGMTAGGAMLIFAAVWKIGSEIQFTSNRAANALITPRPLALNVTPRPKSTTTPTPSALPGQLIPADSALNPSPTPEALTTPAPLNESPLTGSISSLKLEGSAPTISGAEGNLLIEGKTLTLKTTDGGSGDITINPDGNGNLELLFEGDGQKFLSASAPNLTNGTLIYGNVANGATGYNLLQLQNGSSPITRFNVDAAGNVYASGNINTLSNIQINGVTRLNSLGRLTSITGYYQDSGLFAIDQGAADFAKISKVLTTSTGTSTADLLSLKLDESALTTGSNTNTLVLNRLGGTSDALALLVDSGNARFDGVIRLGQFSSDPVPLGGGSVYYNTTDKLPYFYNGTSWDGVATTSSVKWDLANGVVFPKNNSVDLTIGGSATASAKFAFKNVLAGTPTASISGTTSNVATFIDGNGNFSTTNRNNLTLGNSSAYNFTGNILLNPNGTGNVGIGATSPNFPLSFGTALGDKIALYDSGTGNNYGFGIQSALMQLYTIDSGSDITFGYGNSSTMTRNVTFTGAGKVGVGDISPTQTIDIVGTYGIGDVQVLSTGGGANSIYVGDGGVLASGADDNAGVGANALDSLTSLGATFLEQSLGTLSGVGSLN